MAKCKYCEAELTHKEEKKGWCFDTEACLWNEKELLIAELKAKDIEIKLLHKLLDRYMEGELVE